MPQGIILPENQVIAQPGYVFTREYVVGVTADFEVMKPSAVVIIDTVAAVDYAVMEAAAPTALVLGILDVMAGKRIEDPADPALVLDADYKDFHYFPGEAVRVIEGECDLVVILTAGETVAAGTSVVPGLGGEVIAGDEGTCLGWALHAITGDGDPHRLLIHYVPWRNSEGGD